MKILINGKEYHDVSEIPAELRGIYEQAMQEIAKVPVDASGEKHAEFKNVVTVVTPLAHKPAPPSDTNAPFGPDAPPKWQGAGSGTLMLLLGAALAGAAVWWMMR